MKVVYTGKKLSVEVEGANHVEIWAKLAEFQEVFEESCCGKCKSENLRFAVRKVEKFRYNELRCLDCGAKLPFSIHDDGTNTMYPKRKDKGAKEINGTNGWVKWNPQTNKEE